MTGDYEWERSLRGDYQQTPLVYSSFRQDMSLPTINSVPSVLHNAAHQHAPGGYVIPASDSVCQLPNQSLAANSHRALHSSHAICPTQVEYSGGYRSGNGKPYTEHAEYNTVLGATHVPEAHIGITREVPYAGHGFPYARNDPQPNPRGGAGEDLRSLSPDILRDANLLLSVSPNVLDELYNRNWTQLDMIYFVRILTERSEITCQWAACGDLLKVKEIKTHLMDKHDVKSLDSYSCFWSGCSSRESMTQLSSLARHVQERHCSVYWPCPTCERRFTREETLSKHFEKCPGYSKP